MSKNALSRRQDRWLSAPSTTAFVPSNHSVMGLSYSFANSFGASAELRSFLQTLLFVPTSWSLTCRRRKMSSSRTISSLTRNHSSDAVHANALFMSSRSLTCATPAARRRAPVALCTMSQSSLLRILSGIRASSPASLASFPQSFPPAGAPNTFRDQEQNKWTRRRAASSTFPLRLSST